jgi:hypothetical protein
VTLYIPGNARRKKIAEIASPAFVVSGGWGLFQMPVLKREALIPANKVPQKKGHKWMR